MVNWRSGVLARFQTKRKETQEKKSECEKPGGSPTENTPTCKRKETVKE